MQRTYSRKGRRTVSRSADSSPERSPEPAQTSQTRKRRKIQVEVVPETAATSSTAMKDQRRPSKPNSFREIVTPGIGSRAAEAGPSRRSTAERMSRSKSGGSSLDAPVISRSPSKDPLSALFDSPEHLHRPSPSPQKSGGVVKNMLRRTLTESSIVGSGPSAHFVDNAMSSASPSRSPHKLVFSRTESIIDLTLDTPSSSSPQKAASQSQEDLSSSSPGKPVRPTLPSTNVRTYAGKSRSFLVALPNPTLSLSQDGSQPELNESQEDDLETTRESYTDLRLRWGVDNSEDDPYAGLGSPERNAKRVDGELPAGIMNDLKSISELRSKGESRRFLDEVGYLFEGLDLSGAISVRRGSALEIITKLCDEDFARRAKAADFLGKAWDMLRSAGAGEGDKVLDSILAFFAALAARDPVDLAELTSKPDFLDKLFDLLSKLDRSNDPLWLISCGMSDPVLKRSGISRAEKTSLTELHKMVRKKSGLFSDSEIISTRLLLSHTLALLPPYLISSTHLPTLVSSLASETAPLPDRVSAYASGLVLIPELTASTHTELVSFSHVDSCLRLLDGSLLGRWADSEGDVDVLELRKDLPGSLISLCVAADVLSRVDEYAEYKINAQKCLESALRVLVNLTHDNAEWCNGILSSELTLPAILRLIVVSQRQRLLLVQSGTEDDSSPNQGLKEAREDKAAALLDQLCLALGLFTNLVQLVEEVKDLIFHLVLDSSCPGTQKCVFSCHCSSTLPALACLAHVYAQQCASNNDLDTVVRGHMSILLGLLMQRRSRNQAALLDTLPGTSKREKLRELAEHARDFTSFYVDFANKVAESQQEQEVDGAEENEEVDTVGAAAQAELRGGIGRALKDTKGETVAKDVIAFLDGLRSRTYD